MRPRIMDTFTDERMLNLIKRKQFAPHVMKHFERALKIIEGLQEK